MKPIKYVVWEKECLPFGEDTPMDVPRFKWKAREVTKEEHEKNVKEAEEQIKLMNKMMARYLTE